MTNGSGTILLACRFRCGLEVAFALAARRALEHQAGEAEERALDVVLLHRLLIERCLGISEEAVRHESHITYVRELDAAVAAVTSGAAQIAFLLNTTRIDQMRDVAYAGKVMPQKSTDFYPKVLSGLLIYTLDD